MKLGFGLHLDEGSSQQPFDPLNYKYSNLEIGHLLSIKQVILLNISKTTIAITKK